MLSSIHPLGERARANRWTLTATAYVVGTTVGGLATGAAAGAAGWALRLDRLPATGRAWVLVVAAVACSVADIRRRTYSLVHRQVDEAWLQELRGWVYGVGYGVQLGTGVVTIVVTATVYLTWLIAALTADPLLGGTVGAVFGLTRGAILWAGWRLTEVDRLQRFHRGLDRLRAPVAGATPVAALTVAAAVAATALAR